MTAIIQEATIRPDFKIRKGSLVALDFWNDGKPIEARVSEIVMQDDEVFITSVTVGYHNLLSHSAEQYRESGKLLTY